VAQRGTACAGASTGCARLAERIAAAGFEVIFLPATPVGLVSFLGLSVEQVRRLRDEYAIYTVDSARVNIASFNDSNLDDFIDALKEVL
jgi:aspartate/tyrosine/aromatic aminotransferase